MKLSKSLSLVAAIAMICGSSADARKISTFWPGGADVELRRSSPTQNRGTNSELASRVASNRQSVMYVKLPVDSITPLELSNPLVYRMTFRNSNLAPSRVSDSSVNNPPVHPDDYTGLDYWVLDPTNPGADWDELTIAPSFSLTTVQAPGYDISDPNDFSTNGIIEGPGNFTPLGSQKFRPFEYVGTQSVENRYPIGEAMDIQFAPGSPLHQAIAAAQATNHQTITIAAAIGHGPDVMLADGSGPNSAWINFNYLFNPKEQLTLNVDTAYDSDTTDPDNPLGAPLGGMMNTRQNPFAPQILTITSIPEPSSVVLIGLAGLVGGIAIRRRK